MNVGLVHTTLGLVVMLMRAAFKKKKKLAFNFKLFFQLLNCFLGQAALADAGIPYSAVKQACVGYVYGEYCRLSGM